MNVRRRLTLAAVAAAACSAIAPSAHAGILGSPSSPSPVPGHSADDTVGGLLDATQGNQAKTGVDAGQFGLPGVS